MGKPQQTEIIRIADPQKRRVALAKRYPTLFKKARELAILTDSDLFLGVRSSTGRTPFCSYLRGKEIASNIDPHTGKLNSSTLNSSTGPKEWEEGFVKQDFNAWMTKEDLQSLITSYKASLAFALEVLGNLENNPSVKAGDSVVKVDQTEEMTDEGISILNSSGLVNCKRVWTSLLTLTPGSASDPTSSGLDDWEFNTDDDLFRPENSAIGGPFDPTSSDLDDGEFNMDELHNFSGLCTANGHLPENSAIGGPSNPTSSGLDDREFSMDELFELAESGVRNDDRPESSTVGGGFHHLDDFPELEDLDVDLDLHGF